MDAHVEIFWIDEQGILLRSHIEEEDYDFEGEPEDLESPLMAALGVFYHEEAPDTLLAKGFETPTGRLFWESEIATPCGEDDHIEVGERLFLVDDHYERLLDEHAYQWLSRGELPLGWVEILPEE